MILSPSVLPNAVQSTAYSYTLQAAGTPTFTWTITSGSLPPGLALAVYSGVISGTPTTSGTYTFAVRLEDYQHAATAKSFTITVVAPVAITITNLPGGLATTPYSQPLTATGGTAPIAWTLSAGSLPPGLTLTAGGSITGTPTTAGTYNFTATATDSTTPTAYTDSQALSIVIGPALSITTASLPAGLATTGYSQTLAAAGGTSPYTWSLYSGSLPTSLSLSAAGVISGTPSAAGTFNFTVKATDSTSPTAQTTTKAFAVTIGPAVTVTTSTLSDGLAGTSYSQTLAATGGTAPYNWSLASGALPTGLTLTVAGLISGTPTVAGTFSLTVKATDNTSPTPQTATKALSINLGAALSITTAGLQNGVTSTPYSQNLAGTGGTVPYTWSVASGTLPPGLTLSSGTITGTPTTAGTYNFTIQATDSTAPTPQMATRALSITIAPTLTITTASLPNALATTSYSQSLAAAGGTPGYTWSLASGALPTGLALNAAGTISGTPSAIGTFTFMVKVTDTTSPTVQTATHSLAITVGAALTISTLSLPKALATTPYSQPLAATGGTPGYTWSLYSGTLPIGLTLAPSGTITGTPSTPGTYSFTIQAVDSTAPTPQMATQTFSITVGAALTINTSSLPDGIATSPYTQSLAAAGGTPGYTWSIPSGAPPPGLTLNSTGLLSGTPTTAGTYNFTVQATDSTTPLAQTATKTLSLAIGGALAITTSTLTSGLPNAPYSQPLSATGGTSPYTWSLASGTLPPGLSLSSGTITGTPTAAGTYNFTVQATDNAAPTPQTATRALTLTITATLAVSTTALPAAVVGSTYNQPLTASGGTTPYTWTLTAGTLPAGLSLAPSGVITGTGVTAGTSTFTIQVTDNTLPTRQTATKSLSIVTNAALTITTATLSSLIQGQPSSQILTATGGTPAYTWSISTGSLPTGLTLDPTTGALTGSPTMAGAFNITVKVTDSGNNYTTRNFNLTVIAALAITSTSLPNAIVGSLYNQTLAATNGTAPYVWSVSAGSLPPGLTLTPSGALTGTPTAAGSSTFTIQVTDKSTPQQTATQQFTITITQPLLISTNVMPDGVQAAPYSATLFATGGTHPYSWTITSGSLPTGLSLDSTTGTLSGTPPNTGVSTFTVQLTDSTAPAQTTTKSLTITISQPLTITTVSLPHARETKPYAQTIATAHGKAPFSWTITAGTLPAGLYLDPATGSITGTPTTTGTSTFTVQVTDSTNPAQTASQSFSIVTDQAFAIDTSGALPTGTENVLYSFALLASEGTAPYTWSATSGTLPPGLTLNNAGIIAGLPTTAGKYTFSIQASDSTAPTARTATATFTITIQPQLILSTTILPDSVVGAGYSQALITTGGVTPYTWSIASGTLPAGLSLTADGKIAGIPTTVGTSTFTIKLTDASTPIQVISRSFTINISLDITITTATLNNAFVGQPYTQTLEGVGGTQPYSWTIANGVLPAGLSLAATGGIAGTPTAAGTTTFTVGLSDAATPAHTTTRQFTLQVQVPLTITTPNLPDGETNTQYSHTLTAANGITPYTWGIASGSLPSGLALSSSSGILSGTPTAAGTYTFTVSVADATQRATHDFTLTITTGLRITTTAIPAGTPNTPYSTTFTATAGTTPYTWSIIGGTLAPGLTLDASTGTLHGTPTTKGSYSFTVQASDANNNTAARIFSFPVGAVLVITTTRLQDANLGTMYRQRLAAANGVAPYLWTLSAGQLPPGLILLASGDIIGQPTAATTTTISVTVADSAQPPSTATQTFSLTVQAGFAITTDTLPHAAPGVPYLSILTATNGTQPYTFSLALGSLPEGVTLSAAGVISGTPTQPGAYPLLIQATDSAKPALTTTRQLLFLVDTDLSVTTAILPNAVQGTLYSTSLTATNGIIPYSWSADLLPPGLELLPTGELYGTPTVAGEYEITVTVSDASTPPVSSSRPLRLLVTRDLTITTDTVPSAVLNQPYSTAVLAAGGRPPYSFSASGNLPPGLVIADNGILSGTPTKEGAYTFTVTVTDQTTTSVRAKFVLLVGNALTVTSSTLQTGTTGSLYFQFLHATGGISPYVWSINSLPSGLTLIPSLGLIIGTPSQAGDYTVSATVTDSADPTHSGTADITIPIRAELAIPPAELPTAQTGASYVANIMATGGEAPYRWSADTSTLPSGLSITNNGTLQGTITAPAGTFSLSLCVTDSASPAAHVCTTRVLIVGPGFSIDPLTLTPTRRGTPVSYQFSVTGQRGAATFRPAFALPSGLALANDGLLTGAATTSGTYTLTIIATDTAQQTAARDFTLVVLPPLMATTTTLPPAILNHRYAVALTATGGTKPYTWTTDTAALPAGLTLDPTGILYGILTSVGSFPITFSVADTVGESTQTTLTLTVAPALSIETGSLPSGLVATQYSTQLQAASGLTPYAWRLASGSLPPGLALLSDGTITGTPTANGTSRCVVTVSDSTGQVAGAAYTITIADTLSVPNTTTTLPPATVGVPYSAQLSTNYPTAVSWTLILAALPPGLTLETNGAITGTPTMQGTSDFIARAVSGSQHIDQLYAITVSLPRDSGASSLVLANAVPTPGVIGRPYTATLTATGGTSPYQWAVTDGQLPPGLSLSAGTISGTPTSSGIYRAIIAVTDAGGQSASALYCFVIRQPLSMDGSLTIERTAGLPVSLPLLVTGGDAPYTWTVATGALPPGLTLSNGIITGTPSTPGTFGATISVRDSSQQTASTNVSIRILSALVITTTALPVAYPDTPYNTALTAAGGTAPYRWKFTGALPAGITLTDEGILTGSTTDFGARNLAFTVTDATGQTASATLTLTVASLVISQATLPVGTPNTRYSTVLTASGGVPPYKWTITSGSLPKGLTLTPDGLLAGTPTATSRTLITIQVTDARANHASASFTLTIGVPDLAALTLSQLPDPLQAATQIPITLTVHNAPPVAVPGSITLTFAPDQSGRDDAAAAILDPHGATTRTASFTIPAGQTRATFPTGAIVLQTPTLAGTVTLSVAIPDSTRTAAATAHIPPAVPIITSAHLVQRDTYSLQLQIDGFSTTGEIRTADFTFSGKGSLPAAQRLNVQGLFDAWYLSATGKRQGGAFKYHQKFNFTASADSVTAMTIKLTNTLGASQVYTLTF